MDGRYGPSDLNKPINDIDGHFSSTLPTKPFSDSVPVDGFIDDHFDENLLDNGNFMESYDEREVDEEDQLMPGTAAGYNDLTELPPSDKLNLVYMIFYLLGIGTLLPWNFFSNGKEYFMYKLRNSTTNISNWEDADSTSLQNMYETYLAMSAMVPLVIFLFLNTLATRCISLKLRMFSSSSFMVLLFSLTLVLVLINTDSWQIRFLILTLTCTFFMNASSAIYQGGLLGLSSMFPSKYTQAVMAGQAMGGTIAAVCYLLAISFAKSPLDVGFGYFVTAIIVLILAIASYHALYYLKFSSYFINRTECKVAILSKNELEASSESGASRSSMLCPGAFCEILKRVWPNAFGVFVVFAVTLCLYPSITSSIHSTLGGLWQEKYFIPVMCFLFFNLWDLCGRTLAGCCQWPQEGSRRLTWLCLLRLLFIPLFLLCNVQPRPTNFPVFFHHDSFPMFFMALFGTSNGYLGTLNMMYGPRKVSVEDAEMAGSMLSLFSALGLGCGAFLAYLIDIIFFL